MKTVEKAKGNLDMGRKNIVDSDFNKLQHHMKQLELQIRRLREVVMINRTVKLY